MGSGGTWCARALTFACFSVVAGACGDGTIDAQVVDNLGSAAAAPVELPAESPDAVEDPPASPAEPSDTVSVGASSPPEEQVPSGADEASSPSEGSARIDWNGEVRYLHGANLPWVNFGCDFGCGEGGGASSAATSAVVSDAFQRAREMGMNVVRWWVFPGEPTQFLLDADGLPIAVDPRVFPDLDAALDLAEQFELELVLTLFSAPSHLPDSWVDNDIGRARLATVLTPVFARYTGRVMTWQVFNEPEWDFWIWERFVSPEDVRGLVDLVAGAVHESSDALVSVGSARLDGLQFWVESELDYFTVHWYDPMAAPEQCAICTSYGEVSALMGSDAPVLVGEFYAGDSIDARDRFQQFHDRGYAGALAWSLLPDRTDDELAIDDAAARDFAAVIRSDLGPPPDVSG